MQFFFLFSYCPDEKLDGHAHKKMRESADDEKWKAPSDDLGRVKLVLLFKAFPSVMYY